MPALTVVTLLLLAAAICAAWLPAHLSTKATSPAPGPMAAATASAMLVPRRTSWLPLLLALAALGLLGLAIIGAWWRFSRHILSASDLAMAFLYIFWKIPVYLRFAVKRQVEWVRSQRDHEQ